MKKIAAIALFCLVTTMLQACKTCKPEIVYQPVEVPVPVYVQPAPLDLPTEPVLQVCAEAPSVTDKVRCVGGNILKLERYAEELRIVIESHNDSLPEGGAEHE